MRIPGIDPILYKPASVSWPEEPKAEQSVEEQLDRLPSLINQGRWQATDLIIEALSKHQLARSHRMRIHFLHAESLASQTRWDDALPYYTAAMILATSGSDFDSLISLALDEARALYEMFKFDVAAEYYGIALDAWKEKLANDPDASIMPKLVITNYLARHQWLQADFDASLGNLLIVLTTFRNMRIPPGAPQQGAPDEREALCRAQGNAYWTLALDLRARSNSMDGDAKLLRKAIHRLHQAKSLYAEAGVQDFEMGRLYVQIAETYLEIAELHSHNNAGDSARPMRLEADKYIERAIAMFTPANDSEGLYLARLASIRSRVMGPWDPAIHADLQQIEHEIESNDLDLGFRALGATLWAEWLMLLGNNTRARELLVQALLDFERHGVRGMGTRAARLLRRIK